MKSIPTIVMFTHSDTWRSTLEFHLVQSGEEFRIVPTIHLVDCLREIQLLQPAMAIIELQLTSVQSDCKRIRQVYDKLGNTGLIAICNNDLQPWLPLLRVSGFADVCFNFACSSQLMSRIKRQLLLSKVAQARSSSEISIEMIIEDQLPWRPIIRPTNTTE